MNELLAGIKLEIPPKRWLRNLMENPPEDWHCVMWPFTRAQNGYGTVGAKGKIRPHRIMCEWENGPAPGPKHQAAHKCGRGHEGCVNPRHLHWLTASENQLERYRQSGLQPRNKLTPEQVDEIRAMKDRERTVDTAARFGVTEANIRQIQAGKIWKANSIRRRPFTEAEIVLIRTTPWEVKPARQFAEEFGVSIGIIHKIRAGTTYQWVEMSRNERPTLRQPSHERNHPTPTNGE